ncbi:HEAT repeat domain-containing protein [Geoalkalibacter halelectricus]|uniref:HEAT repeat domain-containing protein n=1 Tax=Geoalkalibacter halelectricus TaxID=2847045 RepID=UPI003D1B56D2
MKSLRKGFQLVLLLLLAGCGPSGPIDLPALEQNARSGDAAAMERLVRLLGDPALADRIYPLLIEIGSPAAPALLAHIDTRDAGRREYVIAALGTLRIAEAAHPIAAVLADQTLERRYVAARALGEIGDPASVAPLIAALDDPNDEVRRTAVRALIRLHRSAVPALIEALPGAPPQAAGGMIRALGDIGDARALEVLLAQTQGPKRADALLALGRLRDGRAEPVLIAALADPDWQVRLSAATALGPIGGPQAAAALRRNLDDEVVAVRVWAARGLEMITGQPQLYRNARGEMVPPENLYR